MLAAAHDQREILARLASPWAKSETAPDSVQALVERAWREGVCPELCRRYLPHSVADRERERAVIREWIRWIFSDHKSEGVILIKGLSVERYYPDGYWRQTTDIDVLVPDLSTAWRLLTRLEDAGFTLKRPILLRRLAGGRYVGSAKPTIGLPEGQLKVEINIGAFSISFMTELSYDLLARCVTIWNCEGTRVPVLNREGSFLVLLAELHSRFSPQLRDFYDAAAIAWFNAEEFNWPWILHQVREHHLQFELATLVNGVIERARKEGWPWEPGPPVPVASVPRWGSIAAVMWRRHRYHVLPALLRRLGRWRGFREALFHFIFATGYYAVLQQRGLAWWKGVQSLLGNPERHWNIGRPVQLVRVGEGGATSDPEPRPVPGRFPVVAAAGGVFLLSLWGVQGAAELSAAAKQQNVEARQPE